MTISTFGKRWAGSMVLAAVMGLMGPAPAAGQFSLGGDVSYNNNVINGSWGFGGRVGLQLPAIGAVRPKLVGAGVWYVPSCGGAVCEWWEAQGMLLFSSQARRSRVGPYAGVGASYHTVDLAGPATGGSSTTNEWGVDVIGGTQLGVLGPVVPYAEIRYKIMFDIANQFVFTFGLGIGG